MKQNNSFIIQNERHKNIDHAHKAKGYEKYFSPIFDKIIEDVQSHNEKRFKDFNEEPLRHMIKIPNFKLWPKIFDVV